MSIHEIVLKGCTAEPLISYLKALGVLRLVATQEDKQARGAWRNDQFVLRSSLDEEHVADFFLNHYQPTPIVAPWGARSGFFNAGSEKTAREAIAAVIAADDERFAPFKAGVLAVRSLLAELGLTEKAKDEEKLALLFECRDKLPEDFLPWLDTCYVLTGADRKFPPLLGTGGNEGSGSYVSGFAQQIVSCLIEREHDEALAHALFGVVGRGVAGEQMPGHFSPRNTGGANSGQGFSGPITTNSWDYLLCVEGTCFWAAGVVRKMGRGGRSMAAFPFTVNVSAVGAPSLAAKDSRKPKQAKREVAEMWLPLWKRFMGAAELSYLLAEGRATIGRRGVDSGLDFARAVSGLGIDRGIDGFERVAFLMRNGQSFMGISMGRFGVRARDRVHLLCETDAWLTSFRIACGEKAPARFTNALRRIDRAIFDYCRYGGDAFFQAILVALGAAEQELANGESFRVNAKEGRVRVRPLAGLSQLWIDAAADDTAECEIALALASLTASREEYEKLGPLRANLEPFDWNDGSWSKVTHSVVWHSADLSANLGAVLQRRVLDASRLQCERLPLAGRAPASLSAVAQFLAREVDDQRLAELLWGFLPVDSVERQGPQRAAAPLPRAYSLLKLCFLPEPVEFADKNHEIKPEPAILSLLEADRVEEACEIARRRLHISGLQVLGERRANQTRSPVARGLASAPQLDGRRLAAALLIPISPKAVRALCRQILRIETQNVDTNNQPSAA
jgi:CRISPR-associated protein Csx17